MERVWTTFTAAALLTGLVAASAGAHDQGYDSRVTIRAPAPGVYKGRVLSDTPKCIESRTVKVYSDTGYLLDKDETDSEGRWQIAPLIGKNYYAKVTREVRGSAGHRHVCRPDVSRTIAPAQRVA